MKHFPECEFSAFISYAHADDEAWFSWVTQFHEELSISLRAFLRGVRVPPLHLSGENGPVSGALSTELQKRIAASFAMIIVVHDNYAQSEWCLKELEYFRSLFGDDGFRQRLYIVALSQKSNGRNQCAAFSLRVTVERDASPDSTRPSDIRRGFDNLFKK